MKKKTELTWIMVRRSDDSTARPQTKSINEEHTTKRSKETNVDSGFQVQQGKDGVSE